MSVFKLIQSEPAAPTRLIYMYMRDLSDYHLCARFSCVAGGLLSTFCLLAERGAHHRDICPLIN